MASGDAQRTWFPEMIEMLHQTWSASMSANELLALRDRLETTLETIRSERHILPAKTWRPRTPAMAAGLTDRVWSLREVLLTNGISL